MNDRHTDRLLVMIPPERIASVFSGQRLISPSPRDTTLVDLKHWDDMSLVGAYYDCVFETMDCPTADEFWERYLASHQANASSAPGSQVDAMRWRAIRFYNSQVLEHQLMGYLMHIGMFRSVTKSEDLDINDGADLLVTRDDGSQVGIQLSSPSKNGEKWGRIKAERKRRRQEMGLCAWDGPVMTVKYDFQSMLRIPACRPNGKPCSLHIFTVANARDIARQVYYGTSAAPPPPLSKDLPNQYRLFPDIAAKQMRRYR